MDKALQHEVRYRAQYRCEYCHFPEDFAERPFHIDHIVALQHGGQTVSDNLALACRFCNRYKGPNIAAIDPQSGDVIELFNPRLQAWEEHFSWTGSHLTARTPCGRATIHLLQINRAAAIAVRGLLIEDGVFDTNPIGVLMVHQPRTPYLVPSACGP